MAKRAAFGTTLTRTAPTGGSGLIGQVKKFGDIDFSVDTEDVTSHDSTGGWEEVVPTVLRSGEFPMEVVLDASGSPHGYGGSGLLYQMTQKALCTFTLAFPSGASSTTSWSFTAYVTGFKTTLDHTGAVVATINTKISGSPTLA